MRVLKRVILKLETFDIKSINLIKNISISLVIRGISMFVSLFTLPAYMVFLSNQTITGMWFTAISMLSWILTFDLGIGNGLRNYLVKPYVERDVEEIKRNISSTYISTGIIVLILLIIFTLASHFVNWNLVLNISPEVLAEDVILFMVTILIIGILIQFWLKLITSIFYAMQNSAIPSLLSLISSIMMLIFVLYSKTNDIDYNIKALSIAYAITLNVPYLVATIVVFFTKLKGCAPNIKYFKKTYAIKIIKLGGLFFYLQILTMIMFSTNEFLISWLINPKEVVIFQIYNKLFSILSTFFNLALTPVWSAVTEARIKKDYLWIQSIYSKLNKMLLVLIPFEILLIILMPRILFFWLGNNAIEISWTHCFLFALYNVLFMKIGIDTNIIAGLGTLKVQTYAFTIATLIKICLSFVLITICNSWIVIIVANIMALIPYIVIEFFDIRYRLTKSISKMG